MAIQGDQRLKVVGTLRNDCSRRGGAGRLSGEYSLLNERVPDAVLLFFLVIEGIERNSRH